MRLARTPATALSLTIALLTVGLAATAGTAAAGSEDPIVQEDYIAATSTAQNMPVQHQMSACASDVNVGGLCEEPVPTETNLVVLVDDAALGRVPFHWQGVTADGETDPCPHGHSLGEDTMVLPPGCPTVDVYIGAPATTGTITIKEGGFVII